MKHFSEWEPLLSKKPKLNKVMYLGGGFDLKNTGRPLVKLVWHLRAVSFLRDLQVCCFSYSDIWVLYVRFWCFRDIKLLHSITGLKTWFTCCGCVDFLNVLEQLPSLFKVPAVTLTDVHLLLKEQIIFPGSEQWDKMYHIVSAELCVYFHAARIV